MKPDHKVGTIHLTTDAVEERHRAALMSDVMGQHLAGGKIDQDGERPPTCDWLLAPLGRETVVARVRQGGFRAERSAAMLRDGDADYSLFFVRRGEAQFEQNDRRVRLGPERALLIAHGRPVVSHWDDAECVVLRLPRRALATVPQIDALGGLTVDMASPAMQILANYLQTVLPLAESGHAPAIVSRHLGELSALAVGEAAGQDRATRTSAARAGRLALMQRIMADRLHEPALRMGTVAAAAGVSERTAYLIFEDEGLQFADALYAMRLERALERIRGGYPGRLLDLALEVGFVDLSHFNRRFRARFGLTPGDARQDSYLQS